MSTQPLDVNSLSEELERTLKRLNVQVRRVTVVPCDDNVFVIEWQTSNGEYHMIVKLDAAHVMSRVSWSSEVTKQRYTLYFFTQQVLLSILSNMADQKDMSSIGLLFEGLCAWWDHIFMYPTKSMAYKNMMATKSFRKFMFGNDTTWRSLFIDPEFFSYFITGAPGNHLYIYRSLNTRPDLGKEILNHLDT